MYVEKYADVCRFFVFPTLFFYSGAEASVLFSWFVSMNHEIHSFFVPFVPFEKWNETKQNVWCCQCTHTHIHRTLNLILDKSQNSFQNKQCLMSVFYFVWMLKDDAQLGRCIIKRDFMWDSHWNDPSSCTINVMSAQHFTQNHVPKSLKLLINCKKKNNVSSL